jgi:hypothetical protein
LAERNVQLKVEGKEYERTNQLAGDKDTEHNKTQNAIKTQQNATTRNKTQQHATKRNKTQQNATTRNKTQQNAITRNKTQQNATKRNKTQQNATKRNKTQQNATKRSLTQQHRAASHNSMQSHNTPVQRYHLTLNYTKYMNIINALIFYKRFFNPCLCFL